MTKEEVIKALIKERKTALHENKQAFDMAIKALEQEPCEDCVSRAEVMNMAGLYADWFESSDSYNDFVAELYNLPSVTPIHRDRTVQDFVDKCRECGARYGRLLKSKKGKWITKFHGFPPEPTTVCSKCGFDRDFYIRTGFDKIKFCPNCGAEMESEE